MIIIIIDCGQDINIMRNTFSYILFYIISPVVDGEKRKKLLSKTPNKYSITLLGLIIVLK